MLQLPAPKIGCADDAYGHVGGDRLLQLAATTLESVLRATDLACRLGGDEFAVLLPETNEANAFESHWPRCLRA